MFLIVITTDTIPELIRVGTRSEADWIVQRWCELNPYYETDTEFARGHAAERRGGVIPLEAYSGCGRRLLLPLLPLAGANMEALMVRVRMVEPYLWQWRVERCNGAAVEIGESYSRVVAIQAGWECAVWHERRAAESVAAGLNPMMHVCN